LLPSGTRARRDPRILVGTETRDDAAVFRLDKKRALVATVDFFAPVVDDPYEYGQIAAANSISDVYAMGGTPLYALNVVGWPRAQPFEWLAEILRGGADKAKEADCPIVGGHSVDDLEPKYGLSVTGLVDPRRILTNAAVKRGDVLLLTKKLGTGVAVSAIKKGNAPAELVRAATEQMKALNRAAGEALAKGKGVHALTDVTGFGLMGHLDSMLRAANLRARLDASAIPLLPGVRTLAQGGTVPGGTKANLAFVAERATFPDTLPEHDRLLLADAQTNGGMLAAVDPKAAPKLLRALASAGAPAALVGEVRVRKRGEEPGIDVTGSFGVP
jgi:selenide, water dikinase